MTRIAVVANDKGGTGKTTLTVTLAGALAARGQRVLVVDADPFGAAREWLCGDRPVRVDATNCVAAASSVLGRITVASVPTPRGASAGINYAGMMRDLVRQAAAQSDVVVVDTVSGSGSLPLPLQGEQLELLVPIDLGAFTVSGVERTIADIGHDRRSAWSCDPQLIVARSSGLPEERELLESLDGMAGIQRYRAILRESRLFAEAYKVRKSIVEVFPGSDAAVDAMSVADEFLAASPRAASAPAEHLEQHPWVSMTPEARMAAQVTNATKRSTAPGATTMSYSTDDTQTRPVSVRTSYSIHAGLVATPRGLWRVGARRPGGSADTPLFERARADEPRRSPSSGHQEIGSKTLTPAADTYAQTAGVGQRQPASGPVLEADGSRPTRAKDYSSVRLFCQRCQLETRGSAARFCRRCGFELIKTIDS